MQEMKPMKSVFDPNFIAGNQLDRATNVMTGSKKENLDQIRQDIRDFKKNNPVDSVVILWTANTER
eukprot:CAMPEP_0116905706 /NCGR_PEP_ID=MMETSP0467-20121206/12122_1 /TAXON_ID=283647 /ORGANISM="Mesodinium pulex, Strain SPMC105" /LENGTH=65 /DNA_ID=CAMNT_0004580489 /DNA_START=513 /DNA_END=710 /DNA_ORIENTATION=+